ncbi:MAG: hypothetical protein U0325_04035 [Polyangiales bacterium]
MRPSLRALVVAVVVTVAVLPAPVVALLGALGEARASAVERAVSAAVREARAGLARGEDLRALSDRVARAHEVRLRVLTTAGVTVADVDRDARVARYGGVASAGAGEVPDVGSFDRERGDVAAREGFQVARSGATWTGCVAREGGALWVCEAAAATADGGRVVHAQRSWASAAQRLASAPRPLAWLTAFVLVSGLALAAWLVARIVGPLDALRAALAARAGSARLATQPLALRSPPEVDEVVRAHNAVLAALEGERRARETQAADLVHEIKEPPRRDPPRAGAARPRGRAQRRRRRGRAPHRPHGGRAPRALTRRGGARGRAARRGLAARAGRGRVRDAGGAPGHRPHRRG